MYGAALAEGYNMRHITIITSSPHDSTIHIMSTDICTEVGALFSSCTCCAFVIKCLVVDCYDSFFFLCRSSLTSLPSLRTVLQNAFRLNTASFLHAVHGSLTPFPLTFYRHPSLTRVYLNAASFHVSHCPSLPFTVAQTTVPMFACFSLKSIIPNHI